MIKPVNIKHKRIGKNYPTFIIAEMACAHQGSVENALKMVEVAANSNADAIQLQMFRKEIYISPIDKNFDLICSLELNPDDWSKIIDLIKEKDLLLFVAGYDVESIRFVLEKGVDAFKIHSSDLSNPEVLKEVAKSGKPIFLSCGASTIEEIHRAIQFLKNNGAKDIVLMHGYQGFPTKLEDTHLNYIKTLERIFGLNVGFYDHVDGGLDLAKIIPIMSIGYGSQVVEKHFILSRKEKGIDYESSLEPEDFKKFIQLLRDSEVAIGSKRFRSFTEGELGYRATCKKSIVAIVDILSGSKITRDKVAFLRNDPGIPPDQFEKIVGKVAKKEIKKYHNVKFEDI